MSNDSSFSVSVEDGVEVMVQDNFSPISEGKSLDKAEKSLYSSSTSDTNQTESSKPSLSFEVQVGHNNISRVICFKNYALNIFMILRIKHTLT